MTDDEAWGIRQRAAAALDATADIETRIAERARRPAPPAASAEPAEGKWPVREWSGPPPFVPPVRAQERAVGQIIEHRLSQFRAQITATFGEDIFADETLSEHLQWRFTKSRKLTNDRIDEVEDRMAKSETAVTELLIDFERRLAELEQRAMLKPIKPKLVDDDAA